MTDTNNHTIRKIVIATGAVTTLAGQAGVGGALDGTGASATFFWPKGITTDGTSLYIADWINNKIRKVVIATGVVSSLTGTANTAVTAGAADGPALSASFNQPIGIAIDSTKSVLYVVDALNCKIRQVMISTGAVSSFTGVANSVSTPGAADGAATAATFYYPSGITTDGTNLYVADTNNNKIRQVVITTGVVSSLTGVANTVMLPGSADGATSAATFTNPAAITAINGHLYVATNATIRQIAGGVVSTLAGNANPGMDGTGAVARFVHPLGIVSDGTNLYLADSGNNTIRKIVISTGAVTTLAGQVGVSGALDGTGAGATFNNPSGITTDGTSLYVTDNGNGKIRKIAPLSGSLGAMTSANAAVTSFTGNANMPTLGAVDGAASLASFNQPNDITTDGTSLYVADTGNRKIRKIVIATGVVSSLTGGANAAGTLGATDGSASFATFNTPTGIAIDSAKANLYVADWNNFKIRKVVIATGVVSSVTGVSGAASMSGAMDGAPSSASFGAPQSLATDGSNLYVTDLGNNKIRKIVISTGMVSSVTGMANTYVTPGYADGAASSASFSRPGGVTVVGNSLYVTDMVNNTIRKIQ